MEEELVAALQKQQAGVVARRQVLEHGGSDEDIRQRLRHRRWATVHPGVYVDHTGPLTWEQSAWAAVLFAWPAALAGRSALRAERASTPGRDDKDQPIELVVEHRRRVKAPEGVRVRRVLAYDEVVLANLGPPRVRLEHAVLTTASTSASADAAVATLADACQRRRTTPERLRVRLTAMPRLPRRALLLEVLDDVASGAFSALERRYLLAERQHGLPAGRRQAREDTHAGVVFRDVLYDEQLASLELDGRLGHEWTADRWADLDRDVESAERQRITVRLGWKQVLDPCRLAVAVARILRARGWTGRPRPCCDTCPVADMGASPPHGAGDPPMTPAA